jgi:hypothetical protein
MGCIKGKRRREREKSRDFSDGGVQSPSSPPGAICARIASFGMTVSKRTFPTERKSTRDVGKLNLW